MDPLYWRLIYADDHVEDEPKTNASIRLSHKGAVMLQACEPVEGPNSADFRKAVFQVRLIDVADDDSRIYTPIFYRKRSIELKGRGDSRLEATIIGRAREGKHNVDGTLWISYDGETFEDCPEWAFDREAIAGIMAGA